MDKENFDQHLMDYLFDELDEVTHAAMERKVESDAACRDLVAGLRATIEVAQVPLEQPSDDLEESILAAANLAAADEPWGRKLLRSLSWAGSHAMRPQLAMAAILMLVLGSSILLLRARPGAIGVSASKDTPGPAATAAAGDVRAEPEPKAVAQAEPPQRAAPTARASVPSAGASADKSADQNAELTADLDDRYQRGLANYQAGRHLEAQGDFAAVAGSNNPKAASAAMYEARSVRAHSGPKAAIAYYNNVLARYAGTTAASEATWELADCHNLLGNVARAKQLWAKLGNDPNYKDRAASELAKQGQVASSAGKAVASKRRAKAATPPAATQQANPPSKPGGSGAKAKAATEDQVNTAY